MPFKNESQVPVEESAEFICTVTMVPATNQRTTAQQRFGSQGVLAVAPALENAVRAALVDSVQGGYTPYAPADAEKNVPLLIANGPNRLVPIGFYNHGLGHIKPLSAEQVSRLALAGVNVREFHRALLSLSYSDAGSSCGVLVWTDDDYLVKAYAPLSAVYEAMRYALDKAFNQRVKRGYYTMPTLRPTGHGKRRSTVRATDTKQQNAKQNVQHKEQTVA